MKADKGFSLLEVLIALALSSTLILSADFALVKAASLSREISSFYTASFGG